jgi:hypothetical protein
MSLVVLGSVIGWVLLAVRTLRGTAVEFERTNAGGRGGAIG